MKQFAEAYPISVHQNFILIERELNGLKTISQQAVAKLLGFEDGDKKDTQQVDKQMAEDIFLQSIISRI